MGGHHRAYLQVAEGGRQLVGRRTDTLLPGDALEKGREGSISGRGHRGSQAPNPADAVFQLGQVYQLEIQGEGANQVGGGCQVDAGQLAIKGGPGTLLVSLTKGVCLAADRLLELEQLLPSLGDEDVAEQPAQGGEVGSKPPG